MYGNLVLGQCFIRGDIMKNKMIMLLSITTLIVALSECDCVQDMMCEVKSNIHY